MILCLVFLFLCLLSEGPKAPESFLFVFLGQSSDSSLNFQLKRSSVFLKTFLFLSLFQFVLLQIFLSDFNLSLLTSR